MGRRSFVLISIMAEKKETTLSMVIKTHNITVDIVNALNDSVAIDKLEPQKIPQSITERDKSMRTLLTWQITILGMILDACMDARKLNHEKRIKSNMAEMIKQRAQSSTDVNRDDGR